MAKEAGNWAKEAGNWAKVQNGGKSDGLSGGAWWEKQWFVGGSENGGSSRGLCEEWGMVGEAGHYGRMGNSRRDNGLWERQGIVGGEDRIGGRSNGLWEKWGMVQEAGECGRGGEWEKEWIVGEMQNGEEAGE